MTLNDVILNANYCVQMSDDVKCAAGNQKSPPPAAIYAELYTQSARSNDFHSLTHKQHQHPAPDGDKENLLQKLCVDQIDAIPNISCPLKIAIARRALLFFNFSLR